MTFVTAPGISDAQVTEIWKCVEPNGRPLYTSDRRETTGKKCELVSREVNVVNTPPPPAMPKGNTPAAKSPANFPKESPAQRAAGKERQREVLQKELASEEQDLAKARKELAEQQAIRTGDERNYAKVEERLQPFKDRIETHQKNIDALRRELGNLGR